MLLTARCARQNFETIPCVFKILNRARVLWSIFYSTRINRRLCALKEFYFIFPLDLSINRCTRARTKVGEGGAKWPKPGAREVLRAHKGLWNRRQRKKLWLIFARQIISVRPKFTTFVCIIGIKLSDEQKKKKKTEWVHLFFNITNTRITHLIFFITRLKK